MLKGVEAFINFSISSGEKWVRPSVVPSFNRVELQKILVAALSFSALLLRSEVQQLTIFSCNCNIHRWGAAHVESKGS